MASSAPDSAPEAPMLELTARDSVLNAKQGPEPQLEQPEEQSEKQPEQKLELNGHVSSDEPRPDTVAKPSLINGSEEVEPHPPTNGVATHEAKEIGSITEKLVEAPAAESHPSEAPPANTDKDTQEVGEEEIPVAPGMDEEKPALDDSAPLEPTPVETKDVEMRDTAEPTSNELPEPEKDRVLEKVDGPGENVDNPAAVVQCPVKEPMPDAVMEDKPAEEPAEKVDGTNETVFASTEPVTLPTSEVDLHPASMSQLAIETAETNTSPIEVSVEVSMSDAPAKVAREREDDVAEEPAPKRARTEPKEEEESAVTVSTETPSVGDGPGLASLSKWNDVENDARIITDYQRREIRKIIARIKKTKHGGAFRDSVHKLWPQLWEGYIAKIDKPMDLAEIDRNMRMNNLKTFGDFRKDLSLIYENAFTFNGPAHEITGWALGAIKAVWEDVLPIPEEEPAKPKAAPKPKPKPIRESRALANADAAARRQSAAPTASPAVDTAAAKPRDQQPADLRRASTATEGDRPKRTVRAPKPKDIDYSTKPSRKKLKPELQFCDEVLTELMHVKNKDLNEWFLEAVDAEGLNIPQYYSIIKKPMDLGKVSRMLAGGEISSLKDFDKNVRLIFSNCYTFNGPPSPENPVSATVKQLEGLYNSLMKGKDAWLAKHSKANAPAASNSNASDEEEDDEEFEEEDGPTLGVDPSKEIRELEAKLREESEKLTDLFAADSPNQSLIGVQQVILKMVQEALLKAKQSLSDFRQQKNEKPGKKPGKATKAKASGGAGRKASSAAAQPKKSGGTKKTAPKKSLTAADKDQIANAINDLEGSHLDRAIDIIKRDTGQAENNDGELELDIDQLSTEALLKLWELCKKVLPSFGKDTTAAPASSPEVNRAPAKQAPKTAAKPKKNKPMSAQEQEARIAQLQSLRDLYKPGQEPGDGLDVTQAPTPTAESSDDSDSEEE